MKRTFALLFVFLLFGKYNVLAQDTIFKSDPRATITIQKNKINAEDTLTTAKTLCFPLKKYGICIGNSREFNGIRINLADKNVKRINGLNVTFWLKPLANQNAIVNGISVGVFPTAGSMQLINIGLLAIGASHNLNGLTAGGFIIGSGGNISGLSISGLVTMADGANSAVSGIAVSGIGIGARKAINGIAIAGFAIGTDGEINGVASSLTYIKCENTFKGVASTFGYFETNTMLGVAIAGFTDTKKTKGVSFALYNRTLELHGFQFGLLNYAGNNPKFFRLLPFVNFNLSKDKNENSSQ